MADNVNPGVNPEVDPEVGPGTRPEVDPESLPQTEPTAAPIFDSGPFPEPLGAEADAELAEDADSGEQAGQSDPETWADADSGSWSQGDVQAWSQAEADSDGVADIEADLADEFEPEEPDGIPVGVPAGVRADAAPATEDDTGELAVPARSVVVPGQYSYLKWWKLVLVFAAVWLPAMAIGVGLYYWWVELIDKTPAVFVTLVYVIACTVGGLILAMMSSKPLVAATALAVTSAVCASVIGAAPLYGHYYCQVHEQLGGRCLLGILPY